MQAMYTSLFLAILCTSGVIGVKLPKTKDRNSKTKVVIQLNNNSRKRLLFRLWVSKLSTQIYNLRVGHRL